MFNHEILKPGQEICYKCGLKFKSKSDLLRHIEEKHGHEICHRYLQNKCTVRRCLFRHIMPNAPNVHRISQGGVTQVSTQANFCSLPTAGPVVWSQAVAQGSKIPVMPRMSIKAVWWDQTNYFASISLGTILLRVGKKRLYWREWNNSDPMLTVIVIEPKSGSDIEDKG